MSFPITHASTEETSPSYGALDLGSNSFHLLVAKEIGGRLMVLDRLKETVRLARGVESTGMISSESIRNSLKALERMAERIKDVDDAHLRIVGTNALRIANNSGEFISRAENILGHRIEIIGGREEARLIFLGVSHTVEKRYPRRLVIDIGGGSTELILGQHFQARLMESLEMGCISMSDSWFAGGQIKPKRFSAAINNALQEIEVVEHVFKKHRWDIAIGASGTILAAHSAIAKRFGNTAITLSQLEELKKDLLGAGHTQDIPSSLVSSKRAEVFPGGLAILIALFQGLEIEEMSVSEGALREGIVHDLLGRVHDQDIREKSVVDLMNRFHVDEYHADRVVDTALRFLDQVSTAWDIGTEEERSLLRWAGLLHEIGLDISHSSYHKHGGYLLEHLDIPGFSIEEQKRLGTLVRYHRRKFLVGTIREDDRLVKLVLLLRLAVLLHRNRNEEQIPSVALEANANGLAASFNLDWLKARPLTKLDLENEVANLQGEPISLSVRTHH